MGIFDIFKHKDTETVKASVPAAESNPKEADKREHHNATGTSHYTDAIMKFAVRNPAYKLDKDALIKKKLVGTKVYEYDFKFTTVEIIPEPTNKYDPNAIKVCLDGVTIGYVKKGSTAHINKMIASGKIEKVEAAVSGGSYKLVYKDWDDDGNKEVYKYENDKKPLMVDIYITVK